MPKPVNLYDSSGNPVGTSANPLATSVADGANATIGTTTDAASTSTLVGLLKNIKAALAGTLTIGGTVTSNVGTGTRATSVADGQNVALGTTTDASSGNTVIALLKNLKAALAGTLTVAGSGTFSGSQKAQASLTAALCSAVTGTTPSTGQSLDGYDGSATLEIVAVGTVAAQSVSLQVEGSLDNANWYIVGIAQIDGVTNPVRNGANFTLTPGAATIRHTYQVLDTYKYVRVNPTANTLGTGLTVNLYTQPI